MENNTDRLILEPFPKERVKKFQVRQDDVFLITYPKSGTHWLTQVITLVLQNGNTNDIIPMNKRGPLLEMTLIDEKDHSGYFQWKKSRCGEHFTPDDMESPRFFTTHYRYDNLPTQFYEKQPKTIYLARNPKDISVSYYTMLSKIGVISREQSDGLGMFLKMFVTGKIYEEDHGLWGNHVLDWWKRRHQQNVLFLKYEEVKKDLRATVETVADFLGKKLSPEVLAKIAEFSTFDKMKNDPMARDDVTSRDAYGSKESMFVRKGIVGGWKDHFTVAQSEYLDQYYKTTGLEFEFE
ncbi:sulfotransferase 1B1-like [Glandiceps talaboti]